MTQPVLDVRDLRVRFPTEEGVVHAVDGLTFRLDRGRTLAVVGESGSGKTVAFLAVMGLLGRSAAVEGRVLFQEKDLRAASPRELRAVRGRRIGMVFQDPFSSLHPHYRVGDQIVEAIRAHESVPRRQAWERAVEILALVGIARPRERAAQYPHEFSGGMRQRAMLAMALVLGPDLLIADEPTSALDVTVQAQIMDLIDRLKGELGTSVVVITHDLGVVAEHADDILVMYAGRAAEYGTRDDVYSRAHHPYSWGLLESITRIDRPRTGRLRAIPGLPPSLIFVPPGCPFHPRCPYAMDVCREEVPPLLSAEGTHASACHLPLAEKERIFRERLAVRR